MRTTFAVFVSQQPLAFGSYFRPCRTLLYQSFAVLLKINCLQHKLAFFSSGKKKVPPRRGVNKYKCQKQLFLFLFHLRNCRVITVSLMLALCCFCEVSEKNK